MDFLPGFWYYYCLPQVLFFPSGVSGFPCFEEPIATADVPSQAKQRKVPSRVP